MTPPSDISILNILPARIIEMTDDDGNHVDLRLALGKERRVTIAARLTAQSVHDLQLTTGRDVCALIKAVAIDRQSIAGKTGKA